VVEAGLGKGPTEYLAFQVHVFPGPQRSREVWSPARTAAAVPQSAELIRMPAYADLGDVDGLDDCGLITLAGRSVGAAFVGVAVSSLVIAEVLRELAGGEISGLIDGSLRSLSHRVVMATDKTPVGNPGFCQAAAQSRNS
jgi:hypothetical protein